MTPSEIANQVAIGEEYRKLLKWMRQDLENYAANFDAIFEAKLARIRKHQEQRETDLAVHTLPIRAQLAQAPGDEALQRELERRTEVHKPHGFMAKYSDAAEFVSKYVGPNRKLVKSRPDLSEVEKMNRPGIKELYVDTWAVPFFNSGTQSRAEAHEGVKGALEVFRALDLEARQPASISILRFTQLMALFARPEFDDVRRYKLLPFPTASDLQRFGAERSDAKAFGDKYPDEAFSVINTPIDLGPVSFIFGQCVHIFGLISHSLQENRADGRIFAGPADFLEHDYAHAFFNLRPAIPGTAEAWERVHREYMKMRDRELDPKKRRMLRLVYYHFTHESGFRVLVPDTEGRVAIGAFENELQVIRELIQTRYHYDFILHGSLYTNGYEAHLADAFWKVGGFFRDKLFEIWAAEQKQSGKCADLILVSQVDSQAVKYE